MNIEFATNQCYGEKEKSGSRVCFGRVDRTAALSSWIEEAVLSTR